MKIKNQNLLLKIEMKLDKIIAKAREPLKSELLDLQDDIETILDDEVTSDEV